jgi:hypothetical protein
MFALCSVSGLTAFKSIVNPFLFKLDEAKTAADFRYSVCTCVCVRARVHIHIHVRVRVTVCACVHQTGHRYNVIDGIRRKSSGIGREFECKVQIGVL